MSTRVVPIDGSGSAGINVGGAAVPVNENNTAANITPNMRSVRGVTRHQAVSKNKKEPERQIFFSHDAADYPACFKCYRCCMCQHFQDVEINQFSIQETDMEKCWLINKQMDMDFVNDISLTRPACSCCFCFCPGIGSITIHGADRDQGGKPLKVDGIPNVKEVYDALSNFLSKGNFRMFQLARGGMHQNPGMMADRGGGGMQHVS